MNRQFATMREALGDDADTATAAARRREHRSRHVRGQIVMLDHACPHDPRDATIMFQIGTETGLQVRVALTEAHVDALLEFRRTNGRKR